jgi:copper chaperone CopZ
MTLRSWIILAVSASVLVGTGRALADTTVTVEKLHLCCPQCVGAVNKILKKINGLEAKVDKDDKTVTLTAKDDATIQKALDALSDGGFYGKTDNPKLVMKKVTDVPKGKVTKLELTDVHNCCGQCTKAIKKVVEGVKGVTSTDVTKQVTTFTVEGDFEASAVVQALLDAGFTVKIKK